METTSLDRLAMRGRPDGESVMHQNWENLLFLHWPIEASILRGLVPEPLEIDTFDGKAWIGITPFTLTGLRLFSMPPIPALNSFDELNFRTYVHYKNMPGIWFFSLDASKLIPALAARMFFLLPYFNSDIEFIHEAETYSFKLKRSGPPSAAFESEWRTGVRLRAPDLDSLAFFLVERYCFFTSNEGTVNMTRVYHHPWILEEANVLAYQSNMFTTAGLPEPEGAPLAYFSKLLNVEVWPPVSV
jgi:uncharacterized protein